MEEPTWVVRLAVEAMHHEMLTQHGGLPGVRDETALESALNRARDKWAYDPTADLALLGAAYGYALAKTHGYNDGNKRIAFAVMYTFLGLNGLEIDAPEPAVVQLMVDVASGEFSEERLAEWQRANVIPYEP